MIKDSYSYIAVVSYEDDGISINFPDLEGCLLVPTMRMKFLKWRRKF